jgi:hypothetical protein
MSRRNNVTPQALGDDMAYTYSTAPSWRPSPGSRFNQPNNMLPARHLPFRSRRCSSRQPRPSSSPSAFSSPPLIAGFCKHPQNDALSTPCLRLLVDHVYIGDAWYLFDRMPTSPGDVRILPRVRLLFDGMTQRLRRFGTPEVREWVSSSSLFCPSCYLMHTYPWSTLNVMIF